MTCKAYIQDIQQKPINQKESNTFPEWLHHLEQSTNRVRKELNHVSLLIKCKKENSYSKHQKELLNKYWKKLGKKMLPSQENVETFWKIIWESRSQVNFENTL